MDVNNTPYFLFYGRDDLAAAAPATVEWDERHDGLRLRQDQALTFPQRSRAEALQRWRHGTALALDEHGQLARIVDGGIEVESGRGPIPLRDGSLEPVVPPVGGFVDLDLNGQGRLAAPFTDGDADHGVLLFHLGRRWQTSQRIDAAPLRVAVDRENQVWCLTGGTVILLAGEPLPQPYTPKPERFDACVINPSPFGPVYSVAIPGPWRPLGIAVDDDHVYVLVRFGDRQAVLVRPRSRDPGTPFRIYRILGEGVRLTAGDALPFCIDIAPADQGRLALLVPGRPAPPSDCLAITIDPEAREAEPVARVIRERYPMWAEIGGRFVASADGKLRYQGTGTSGRPFPRRLVPLQRPEYEAEARVRLQEIADSQRHDTVWHRIYVEGCVPAGCDIALAVAPVDDEAVGNGSDLPEAAFLDLPALQRCPFPSELPFHRGVAADREDAGLFEVLVQRPAGADRRIIARRLAVRATLTGTRRHTPTLHALRVYHPRFSYQEAYLPQHFRQQRLVPAGDAAAGSGPANGADVRERLLAAFEGMLTPIEGRVAAGEALLHPRSAPPGHLPWMAEILAAPMPGHWPEDRQRRLIEETGLLQQERGTYAGVRRALDIATDGGVQRGQVVVVENFRLRRTMATVLGIDMDDRDHPLTLGTGMSGNSIVGDTLVLSEEDAREFLALFAPAEGGETDEAIVAAFFERYGHQLSILLHGAARAQRDVVEEALDDHLPAHLEWRVIETDHPFVLGLAPLLAVDTFVETAVAPRVVVLDDTYLGREGVIENPHAFSPEDANARTGGDRE